MKIDYAELAARLTAVAEGETDHIALMATVVCEIHHADDRFDWTGFYRAAAPGLLKVGPYQGGHGCLSIPFERGVCGAAARTGKPQLVPDVDHVTRSLTTGDHETVTKHHQKAKCEKRSWRTLL